MLFDDGFGQPEGFYQIDRSLRFNDDDSAYLSRTPGSAGNRKTWTLDIWCKRGNLGTTQYLWSAGSASTDYTAVFFDTNNKLNVIRVISSATDAQKVSTAVFRDPSAWYDITVEMDAANTNLDVFVNGVEITAWDTNNEPSNIDGAECNTVLHTIGARSYTQAGTYFDGYIAYAHFLDGTASAPFTGGFDVDGIWRPEAVSATYGTTGWYLSFADNTSTTTLGYDDAGSNDWTLNNFSVTAGAGNDSLEDTPTNNFCTFNPLKLSSGALSNGNLTVGSFPLSFSVAKSTFGMTAKCYMEFTSATISGQDQYVGMLTADYPNTATNGSIQQLFPGEDGETSWRWRLASGVITRNAIAIATYSAVTSGGIARLAYDPATRKVWAGNDSGWFNSGDPAAGIGETLTLADGYTWFAFAMGYSGSTEISVNFGQRAFTYTPPSGFVALCTANLPTPDIANPGSYMNAVTYTGNGTAIGSGGLAVTGVGFQPDLVWIKNRDATDAHMLFDSVRGVTKFLESNTTDDEATDTESLTTFGADGFTVGNNVAVNTNTEDYVGWCWREGVTPGFDIVTYTGTGVARTIAHNLGTVPKLIIVKARSTASTDQGWPVYHASNTTAPETDYLLLNSTAGTADLDTVWNDTAPTTTVFSVGTNALVNALNDTYVAYLWSEIEGFSKFGSYTGNGSADGPFVWCGFRPKFVLIRYAGGASNWSILDTSRNTFNVADDYLQPQVASAEVTAGEMDFLSNGFKIRNTSGSANTNGGTMIFAAFASQPFSAPANAR